MSSDPENRTTVDLGRRKFTLTSLAAGMGIATLTQTKKALSLPDQKTPTPAVEKTDTDVAQVLVKHVIATHYDMLPADLIHVTKMEILDTLGIAIAGAAQPGVVQLRELVTEWAGKPEANILGTTFQVPAQDAAQVNATMAHALDYDDTHERCFVHPSVVTVPPALAAAQLKGGLNGRDFITAVATGVDLVCRLALAAQPGVNAFDVGWHNTTLYGYMNSALTAGKILALDEQQLLYAMGIAYHQSAGNAQAILDGALTKRLGPGFSVRAGVMAARLAQKGVTGATRPLEGAKGMYALYHHNNYDRNLLLNELGQRFEGINVSFKPYPCCRGTHPSIDAALNLANRHNINPADIAEIIAINGPGQYNLLSTPLETKTRPQTPVDAQFSIPWTVAVALHNREVKMRDFTPTAIANPHILALTAKTRTELDPTLVRPGGGVEPARVDVVLVDGTRLSETVLTARGEPDARLTYEDSAAKFLDCAVSAGLPQNAIDQVINQVADLETMTDVTRLVSLLA